MGFYLTFGDLKLSRELTSHKVNGLNEALKISVLDEPGAGGACHRYAIRCTEPTLVEQPDTWDRTRAACDVNFQNGPIGEVGVNGISQEALLAIVEAMDALKSRTRERMQRGVEGTMAK